MTEPREFCESCQRWLVHDQLYCPLFPDTLTAAMVYLAAKRLKWDRCVCLVHTCYEAPKRDRAEAPEYRDFP